MSDASTVTVLIPARNEEADIERCLRAVLAQDHPHDHIEIVLVDGGSTDRTVETATRVLEEGDIRWQIIDNPIGTTPSNLNAGLAVATGEVLCRVDARSVVPPEYVRLCADLLTRRPEVVATGGAQVAVAVDGSLRSSGIARALNNRFSMGGSRYRSGSSSGASDTVYLGAFRTRELRAVGAWDEYFHTNQDYELNRRLGRSGTVWFDARLNVDYVPRRSLGALWQQYHRFGRWKVRYWRRTEDPPRPRQVIPLLLGPTGALFAVTAARRQRIAGPVLVASGFLAVLDAAGASERSRPPVRLFSMAAIAVTVAGWISGVYREALFGCRQETL